MSARFPPHWDPVGLGLVGLVHLGEARGGIGMTCRPGGNGWAQKELTIICLVNTKGKLTPKMTGTGEFCEKIYTYPKNHEGPS